MVINGYNSILIPFRKVVKIMDVNSQVKAYAKILKAKVKDFFFKKAHRREERDFSRMRKLSFAAIIFIMINYKTKSNDLSVYNFLEDIMDEESVTRTAYEAARDKIKSSAFKELYDDSKSVSFSLENPETFHGYRVSAIDGTTVLLPKSKELLEKYGESTPVEGKIYARISFCADVLNGVILDGEIEKFSIGERTLAMRHIQQNLPINPLLLYDRGYWDPKLVVAMIESKQKFVMRVAKNAIKEVTDSKDMSGDFVLKHEGSGYTLRYYKFLLDSGEMEYLVTNLDRSEVPDSELPELYHMRWGVETKYDELKNRLKFEDFSGKSVNAIEQEFYASLIVMNMTGFAIAAANIKVKEKKRGKRAKYEHKPNGNMAVGILKDRLIKAIIIEDSELQEKMIDKLVRDISKHTLPIKPDRKNPRNMENSRHRRKRRLKTPL